MGQKVTEIEAAAVFNDFSFDQHRTLRRMRWQLCRVAAPTPQSFGMTAILLF
jgi:hypothetical protein